LGEALCERLEEKILEESFLTIMEGEKEEERGWKKGKKRRYRDTGKG
jgi:hypothetical protein